MGLTKTVSKPVAVTGADVKIRGYGAGRGRQCDVRALNGSARLDMAKTICLPVDLGGASLSWAAAAGSTVRASAPVVTFQREDRSTVPLAAEADSVVWRVLPNLWQECAGGAPIVILGAPGEALGYDAAAVQCVRVAVLRKCAECGNDYPVNGLVKSARCTRCGDHPLAPEAFWRGYSPTTRSEPAPPESGPAATWREVTARARWSCGASRRSAAAVMRCSNGPRSRKRGTARRRAARRTSTAPRVARRTGCAYPPPWTREVFRDLALLVGETATETRAGSPDDSEAARPVVFKCPSCVAALEMDGVRRIVHCRFCGSDVYLPDDLWLHFNPSTRRGRWWMLFR